MRCSKYLVYFLGVLALLFSCKKDSTDNNKKENEPEKLPKVATALVKASVGGTLETADSIKMVIPAGALSGDATVSVGITGKEPKTVPNQNLTVTGRPFTIAIPSEILNNTITIIVPKPKNFVDTLQTAVFAYNGDAYYPMYYTITGNDLKISIDVTDWATNDHATQARSVVGIDKGELTIMVVKILLPPPPDDELGLKRISLVNGKFNFSTPQITGTDKKVLLLVHGLRSSPSSCWTNFLTSLISRSSSGYTEFWTYGYNTSKSIEDNGFELSKLLKQYKSKIDIIGHSMGGLVARTAIENGGCSEFVEHLVTLGTPHQGSSKALINSFIGLVVGTAEQLLFDDFYAYNNATQGVRDLLGSSAYINKIKNQRAPIPYYTIAATSLISFNGLPIVDSESDGLVTVNSATNVSGATGPFPIPLSSWLPHVTMTDDIGIIGLVANYLNTNSPKPVDLSSFAGTYSGPASYTINFPTAYKSTIDINETRSINDFKLFLFQVYKDGQIGAIEINQGYGEDYGNVWQYRWPFGYAAPVEQKINADGTFNFTRLRKNENHMYNFVQSFSGRISGNVMSLTVRETGPCFNYSKNYVNGPGSANPTAPNPNSPWSLGEYAGDFTRTFNSSNLTKQ
ncbi:MAG: hypothetical protein QM727_15255 [Niabella sp.]